MPKNISNNLAKELLAVLANVESDFIKRLPDEFIENLTLLAADADRDFYIEKDKPLDEQNLSEECKDWLALLYYQTSDYTKQKELLNAWSKNDIQNDQ